MRSRTKRKWGDVYRPILEGGWHVAGADLYCATIEEMIALVEPLPFVPAMWIGLRRLKSEGYAGGQLQGANISQTVGAAHLVAQLATPLEHLWNGLLIHAAPRLADGIDNGEVGLQRVQGRYRRLAEVWSVLPWLSRWPGRLTA